MDDEMPRMTRAQRATDRRREKLILLGRDGWQDRIRGTYQFCQNAGLRDALKSILDYLTGRASTELPAQIIVESPTRLTCNGWSIEYDESKMQMVRLTKIG